MKDIAMLDKMYELNKVYFKELSMYILAGKKKLAEVESTELPAAQRKPGGPACRRMPRQLMIFPPCAIVLRKSCMTWINPYYFLRWRHRSA